MSIKKVFQFWKWKMFHPFSQWNCLKKKEDVVMIPLTAAAIAEKLFADDGLYEEVTDIIEGMAIDHDDEQELEDELIPGYIPDFSCTEIEPGDTNSVSRNRAVRKEY